MDYAIHETRNRERTPKNLIAFSILGSLMLHLLFIVTIDIRQSTFEKDKISTRPALRITVQSRLVKSPQNLPAQTQDIKNSVRSEPATDEAISTQIPSQKDIPMLMPKKKPSTSSKVVPRLDLIRLQKITRDVVNNMTDKELENSPESSILGKDLGGLGEDLPTLPELNQVLKSKHTSIQKFTDGLIKIVLPSGRSYCIREIDGFHAGSPSTPPPIATNCP